MFFKKKTTSVFSNKKELFIKTLKHKQVIWVVGKLKTPIHCKKCGSQDAMLFYYKDLVVGGHNLGGDFYCICPCGEIIEIRDIVI